MNNLAARKGSPPPREGEEACSEMVDRAALMSDSTRNRPVARAGHAMQPEDAPAIRVIDLFSHLSEEFNVSVKEALWGHVGEDRVESGAFSIRQIIAVLSLMIFLHRNNVRG